MYYVGLVESMCFIIVHCTIILPHPLLLPPRPLLVCLDRRWRVAGSARTVSSGQCIAPTHGCWRCPNIPRGNRVVPSEMRERIIFVR